MAHTRRRFLGGVASLAASSMAVRRGRPRHTDVAVRRAASQAPAAPAPKRGVKLGLNHFGIRAFGWKATQLIDYAASQQLDAIFLSELNVLEKTDEAYLTGLRAQADKAGLAVYLGMCSICPTSGTFDPRPVTPSTSSRTPSGSRKPWIRR